MGGSDPSCRGEAGNGMGEKSRMLGLHGHGCTKAAALHQLCDCVCFKTPLLGSERAKEAARGVGSDLCSGMCQNSMLCCFIAAEEREDGVGNVK